MNDKEVKELLDSLKIIVELLHIIAEELESMNKDNKR